jgi:hypothetical protein
MVGNEAAERIGLSTSLSLPRHGLLFGAPAFSRREAPELCVTSALHEGVPSPHGAGSIPAARPVVAALARMQIVVVVIAIMLDHRDDAMTVRRVGNGHPNPQRSGLVARSAVEAVMLPVWTRADPKNRPRNHPTL